MNVFLKGIFMILIRLSLMLITLNLINASMPNNAEKLLEQENYNRVVSYNSKISNFAAVRDFLEVSGNVLQQTGLACFAVGNADWCKPSPVCSSINLLFVGSVATIAQAFCFGIAKFCNREVKKCEDIVKELLGGKKIPSQAFDVLGLAKPKFV